MNILTPESDPFFFDTLYQNPLVGNVSPRVSPYYAVNPDTLLLENISEDGLIEYVEGGILEEMESYWDSENQTNDDTII